MKYKSQAFFLIIIIGLIKFSPVLGGNLLSKSAVWKYHDGGVDLGYSWKQKSFNDANWKQGVAEFGFGDAPQTMLKKGNSCYYFRKIFNLNNPQQYASFITHLRRDDGVIVYLNGIQVFKNNLPTSGVNYQTLALNDCHDDGDSIMNFTLSPGDFVNGVNVLAVEIHNSSSTNDDLSFELEIESILPIPSPQITRGPYLQSTSPTTCILRWRTDVKTDSKVNYGLTRSYGDVIQNTELLLDHEVKIEGLNPDTKYFYRIGSTALTLEDGSQNYFFTAPSKGTIQALRIWALGDFGNGTIGQQQVLQSYLDFLGNEKNDMWIWLGDNAYYLGTDNEYGNYVFNVYEEQFKNWNFFPALGNHDYAQSGYLSNQSLGYNFPYFDIFNLPEKAECGGVPSATEKYYSYDWGNVHFIALDSYGSYNNVGSPMYQWLLRDLQMNASKWIIAYWHHPPFSKGTHNSDWEIEMVDMRQNIVPLLERFGVDLVLTGHSHTYERSNFMHGHYGVENTFSQEHIVQSGDGLIIPYYKDKEHNGTVYTVCGVGGGPNPGFSQGYPHDAMISSYKDIAGSSVIDVHGDTLHFRFLKVDGSIGDEFYILKNGNPRYEWNDSHYLSNPEAFPNPSSGIINIFPGNPILKNLEVYNQQGALLYTDTLHEFKTIDLEFLGKGIFQFVWKENEKRYTQKVILE